MHDALHLEFIPAQERDMEVSYNKSQHNFTWSVVKFEGQNLDIDVTFDDPTKISPLIE